MKILAIDADSFAYRLGPSCVVDNFYSEFDPVDTTEDAFEGTPPGRLIDEVLGEVTVSTSMDLAKELITSLLEEICENTGTTEYTLHITPGSLYDKATEALIKQGDWTEETKPRDNFRYAVGNDLSHAYKHNRKTLLPSGGVVAVMASLIADFGAVTADGCEADDVVCALGRRGYIVSAIDKDVVNQTVGKVWNYNKQTWVETTEDYVRYYKYYQAICGDPGDGYKGVPGVGPKGCEEVISVGMSELELFDATLACYESKGMGLQECLATLRLADMHQLEFVGETDQYYINLYEPPEGANI